MRRWDDKWGNTDNTDALIDSIALASDDGNDDEGAMNMDVEENDFDHDNNSNRKVTFDSNGKLSQQILEVQDNKVLNNGRDGGIINLIEEEIYEKTNYSFNAVVYDFWCFCR